jgi:hypothetical protein
MLKREECRMINKEVMLWNNDRTQSVRASKIRSFMITSVLVKVNPVTTAGQQWNTVWRLTGWYNEEQCFTFGEYASQSLAEYILNKIHEQIEGR